MGIEPTRSAWKADVLPLNYARGGSPAVAVGDRRGALERALARAAVQGADRESTAPEHLSNDAVRRRSRALGGGGENRIRTCEGRASRFTVCPLWPLGNLPLGVGSGGIRSVWTEPLPGREASGETRCAPRVLGPTNARASRAPDRLGDRGRRRPTTLARMPGTGAAAASAARRAGRGGSAPVPSRVSIQLRGSTAARVGRTRRAGLESGRPGRAPAPPRRGASGGSRTHNLLITNQVLCQLSYAGPARVGGSPNEPVGSRRGDVRMHASGAARRVEGEIVGFASPRSSVRAGNWNGSPTPRGS